MKFSFSLPSKPSPVPSPRPDPNATSLQSAFGDENGTDDGRVAGQGPTFITVFDPSESRRDPSTRPFIRPLENTWRADNRRHQNSSHLPINPALDPSDAVRFTMERMNVDEDGDTAVCYGLNLRPRTVRRDGSEVNLGNEGPHHISDDEIFRAQLDSLPDHRGAAEYEEMPVGEFGRAVLRGYGWTEGQGVGRRWSSREDVPIVEPKRCIMGQGLGFKPRREKTQ